ncbi:arginine--tRNA ligase [Paracoccus denitrificans]|uniref:Arginine--tRNA ligase n=1 Tax=Paracoccus denitrificans (strain Pd 1222) TaxID=318586 RepID=SYR_PARDP|nr:arginine--tRNA ligase [Paracoccus denitrificans]A1B373.1 RecName: Full=Arginine--tRNA ligase; AltName: Full=Arginyl-tRNA synthetase; Short=ArgRS [Paracoccus denitrificans PD1222]ABL69967.1 arginyl-tRNA synthetase [Paracoccus denitrificans PD1222]MBB4627048.1 arginyl-tRNA synthetase [Paracoccus denitrificans]MCU7428434.1 arginine--tRNA ligase [Paracoccus denitrificans]QAR25353.1 arginine--tRNA ligase [Paracoccus denitrificans]UPV94238.1 arginine--tRNA ligase [Paracoccus denitrificans]
MNLFSDIRTLVIGALAQMEQAGELPAGLDTANVTVEPPRDAAHGDMATNAAMVLAKPAGKKPRDIAEALAARLAADPRIASAEVAGPGFLNLRLVSGEWQSVVRAALAEGGDYGRSEMGRGQRINVEFVSANPTGPMHVGHTRGAVFGDALAALLDFSGHEVTREYYINDGGAQVDVLARSAYERYREANGLEPEIREGLYPGDYLIPVGEALKTKYGETLLDKPEEEWLAEVRDFATRAMMDMIREDLALLNVHMDVFSSEKALYGTGRIEAAIERLRQAGLIYEGVLEPPKGKTPEDWEPREQTLFRSTAHGDDVDRPVKKSDGSWTYFAPDIAYHWDKIERGYDALIDVFGADHGGYVKRMTAAVKALSDGRVPLDVKLIQLVRLFKNGEPFKMSKRAGTFVTLRDVVEQAGADVTRFHMLTRKNDAALDFDFARVLEQSKDNPVWYVQYASARVNSVLNKAAGMGVDTTDAALAQADLAQLSHPAELELARKVAEWPRTVEIAARAHEPHRIAFFLYDIASELHSLWNRGNDEPALRFLQEGDPAAMAAKIALARSVGVVISAGLGILGVTPAKEMR